MKCTRPPDPPTGARRREVRRQPPAAARAGVAASLLLLAAFAPVGGVYGQWHDVAEETGLRFVHHHGDGRVLSISESGGSGGAWLDYDSDGDLDAFLVDGLPGAPGRAPASATDPSGHRLYRNHRARFEEAPVTAGVAERLWGHGAAVGDVDNDGFPDLLVTALGADRLYRNNGDGSFTPWPGGVEETGWSATAAFLDWDGDGFLDLYVTRYVEPEPPRAADDPGVCTYRGTPVFCGPEGLQGLPDRFYRNRGDGTFEHWPGLRIDPAATYGFAVVAFDCDQDVRPELYVATDSTINLLYRRTPVGIEDWALFGGSGYSGDGREQAGMGVTAADFDEDGRLDLYVTNFQNDHNTLYRNLGGCDFEDATASRRLATTSFPYMGWAAQFFDADGDGDQDLFVANGHIYPGLASEPYRQRNLLYYNLLRESGVPDFRDVTEAAGPGLLEATSSRAAMRGDYDDDGDMDLLVTNVNAQANLLRNDGVMAFPALRLSLVGRASNRSAYGASVVVESGGIRQRQELRHSDGYLGSNDTRLLFHLPGGRAEILEVRWPSGARTLLQDQPSGWLILDESRGVVARRSP